MTNPPERLLQKPPREPLSEPLDKPLRNLPKKRPKDTLLQAPKGVLETIP